MSSGQRAPLPTPGQVVRDLVPTNGAEHNLRSLGVHYFGTEQRQGVLVSTVLELSIVSKDLESIAVQKWRLSTHCNGSEQYKRWRLGV